MNACYCLEQVLLQRFIILKHSEHEEMLINEGRCLIHHNAHCGHVVVRGTLVLPCNSQIKHSPCQFTIHLDAFFFSFFCFAPVRSACLQNAAQSLPKTTGPCHPVVRKYSSHPWSDVEQIAHRRLSVEMKGDKEKAMQQKERDWDVLLYSPLYPHTQTLISPRYVSL